MGFRYGPQMKSTIRYRAANSSDTDAICALWAASGVSHGSDADRQDIGERLKNDDGFFIVGIDDEGTILSSAMGCYDNHRGMVKRVAVAPEIQGTGEGTRLVEELERRFVAAGITELRLAVFRENERAGAFWESKGYEELTNIRYFVKSLNSPTGHFGLGSTDK